MILIEVGLCDFFCIFGFGYFRMTVQQITIRYLLNAQVQRAGVIAGWVRFMRGG